MQGNESDTHVGSQTNVQPVCCSLRLITEVLTLSVPLNMSLSNFGRIYTIFSV